MIVGPLYEVLRSKGREVWWGRGQRWEQGGNNPAESHRNSIVPNGAKSPVFTGNRESLRISPNLPAITRNEGVPGSSPGVGFSTPGAPVTRPDGCCEHVFASMTSQGSAITRFDRAVGTGNRTS